MRGSSTSASNDNGATHGMSLGSPHSDESTPPDTRRTHSPAWQPLARHDGMQKCVRPHSRQNAARQVEHHPNGSDRPVPQAAQLGDSGTLSLDASRRGVSGASAVLQEDIIGRCIPCPSCVRQASRHPWLRLQVKFIRAASLFCSLKFQGRWLGRIEAEPIGRAHRTVWCNMATVDSLGRPRSRIVHPIWAGSMGWIATHPGSFKNLQLAAVPFVSWAYTADIAHPVYADCIASGADDRSNKQRIWNLFATAPEPLGYDPAPFFFAPGHPNFGRLRLTPWRIAIVTQSPPLARVWHDKVRRVLA